MYIVGRNLKRIINERGLKIKKVSELVGVSEAAMYNYVNGRAQVPTEKIPEFCKLLDVEPNDLFQEELPAYEPDAQDEE